MKKEILIIGGTGMIGKLVLTELIKHNVRVYCLLRNSGSTHTKAPNLEYIQGDVTNKDQIKKVIDDLPNLTHIYFHPPASLDVKGLKNVDLPGTRNILHAIRGKDIHLIKLSEIGAWNDPKFYDISQKYLSENETKAYASKWTILRPTWFMESIPNLLTTGKISIAFGNKRSTIHWLAGKDYAKTVLSALNKPEISLNKTFVVQGPNALSLPTAIYEYNTIAKNGKLTLSLPLSLLKAGYYLSPSGRFNYEIMNFYDTRIETFEADETWKFLHKPIITLRDFATDSHVLANKP